MLVVLVVQGGRESLVEKGEEEESVTPQTENKLELEPKCSLSAHRRRPSWSRRQVILRPKFRRNPLTYPGNAQVPDGNRET